MSLDNQPRFRQLKRVKFAFWRRTEAKHLKAPIDAAADAASETVSDSLPQIVIDQLQQSLGGDASTHGNSHADPGTPADAHPHTGGHDSGSSGHHSCGSHSGGGHSCSSHSCGGHSCGGHS